LNQSFAADLYFGLQRLRGGVSPDQIRFAEALLARPWAEIRTYVAERLAAVHGPQAAAPGWLAEHPLVARSELIPRMQSLSAHPGGRRIERRKTSGSTGTPFRFVKDVRMTAWMDAAMWAAYGWHGIVAGDRQARFWGAPLTPWAAGKRAGLDWVLNRRRLGAFRIDARTSAAFLDALRRFRPAYAYGYPTLIDAFVGHCTAQGLSGVDLGLRVVICTGEILLPAVRERARAFFGCPVVNEYGCSESGVLALECERGTLHMIPVAAHAEVVTPEGAPTAPGEAGEVVVSDLYGEVEPLLRYRLHDRARLRAAGACPCGRQLPSLAVEEGRIDAFILTPHRGRVYDAILAYTVPPEVFRFRARQVAPDRLEVEIVPGEGYDAARTPAECVRRWQEALGPGMEVLITEVREIPLTAAGKLRYFVPLASTTPTADARAEAPPAGLGSR
jgi:phenylacetate-CoA ligase